MAGRLLSCTCVLACAAVASSTLLQSLLHSVAGLLWEPLCAASAGGGLWVWHAPLQQPPHWTVGHLKSVLLASSQWQWLEEIVTLRAAAACWCSPVLWGSLPACMHAPMYVCPACRWLAGLMCPAAAAALMEWPQQAGSIPVTCLIYHEGARKGYSSFGHARVLVG